MRLVLFDIDGTLLLTGKVGQTSAKVSLKRVFGTAGRLDEFYPGGRTIEGIFVDALVDAGISEQDFLAKREELYADFFAEFQGRVESGDHETRALPGAMELVQVLASREDVLLGLVTGNHQATAEAKLKMAGFDPALFKVGAYGHESTYRPDLIPLVQQRAMDLIGQPLNGQQTVVIGDTTRDVISAKEAGARSIAVTTGTDDQALLNTVEPDFLLNDLRDVEAVIRLIMQ